MAKIEFKYKVISDTLKAEIISGKYSNNRKLPSETQLMRRFKDSRATVIRALQELCAKGLVVRRKGQGSFLTDYATNYGRTIGLVIPISRGEIFPPICREITHLAQRDGYAMLLADIMTASEEDHMSVARRIMEDFVSRKVIGVIFHLVDGVAESARINKTVLEVLDTAGIPVVLTDSDYVPFPQHGDYDVVGEDGVDAGYRLARHMLACGARRLMFFMPEFGSTSFANRSRGFKAADEEGGVFGTVATGNPRDAAIVATLVKRHRPDGIICGNDRVAVELFASLSAIGKRVPQDLLLAGFDDVNFARLLSPGLTTMHLPCAEIGHAAYETLLARVREPHLSPRTVIFSAPLVVRASTGAKKTARR